ncbi:MAG: 4Fe-4S binding protein, partial [Gammaproteobacteria bacterium]|nr:4Fe-4S binding protein [Gammaproteobacteria bacterium]
TLLERVEPLLDERPPLYQQIAAIASPSCRLHSLLYGSGGMPLRSADLIAACQLTPQSPAHPLHLGAAPFSRSNNPKQQVQHDLLERHYPMLGQCSQHGSHSDHFLQPEGTISVAVVHRNHPSHHPLCWQLAEQLYQATGEEVRAESQSPHTSDWGYSRIDCLSHSPHPLPSLDPESPLDLLIVVGHTPQQGIPALERLKRGGALLIDPAELGYDHYISALPVENFRQLQQREILLYTVTPDASTPQLIGHCFSLIGQIAEIDLRESRLVSAYRPQQDREQFQQALAPMQPHTLPSAQESVSPLLPTTPVAVRHLAQMEMESHAGYQSLSRFWDQTGVLYRDGEADQQGITPFGATGGVPPLTATFSNHTSQRETLPHFDPALCSGCGACWSYCPDSAIGATSLTPAQLLETALQMGGADALRPHLSKLAKQLSLLSESGNAATLIQQGWDALMAQAPLAETRRASAEAALATVISNLEQLPLAHTEPLFHQREQQKPQAGELLTVVINPDSCKGCGLCTTLCSEEASRQEQEQAALTLAPQQPTSISLAYQQWRVWEQLPDSASSTLIEYASRPEIGPLRATLLSRYAAMAVSGGDSAEPGSGEKLVVRQLLAITEYRQQPLVHQLIQLLDEHYEQLMGGIREQLAAASHVDDLAALAEGLGDLTNRQITLTTLAEKTTNIESSGIDAFALKEWIDLAESISEQRQQISSGSQSLGRARYSLAFANGTASGWAGSFPLNPFQVPVVIGDSAEIGAFASGLLSGQLEQATECHRLLHQAKNLLKGGAIAERKAMKQLVWHNLSAEEQQQCPPLLLIGNDTTLGAVSAGGVSWLLNSALPVKIIVLAEMDLGFAGEAGLHGSYHTHADARAELALSALAQRNAYVAQSSLAHPNHLNQSMREALHHPGPALLRIHAPSPQRHGFAPEQTLIQAARIVAGRAFPLFRYNPQRSGVFGTRITLEGNPDEVTSVAHWAYYERRFRGLFHPISSEDLAPTPLLEWLSLDQRGQDSKTPTISEENMEVAIDLPFARRMGQLLDQWQMLQELAGVVTPFTEQVKQEVESAVAANHQAELDALRESHQQALQALREQLEGEVSQRITSRLSALVERSTPTTLV